MTLEDERDEYRRQLIASNEMLALVLSETGPVTIKRAEHQSVPAGAQITVNVNQEEESVTIALAVPSND